MVPCSRRAGLHSWTAEGGGCGLEEDWQPRAARRAVSTRVARREGWALHPTSRASCGAVVALALGLLGRRRHCAPHRAVSRVPRATEGFQQQTAWLGRTVACCLRHGLTKHCKNLRARKARACRRRPWWTQEQSRPKARLAGGQPRVQPVPACLSGARHDDRGSCGRDRGGARDARGLQQKVWPQQPPRPPPRGGLHVLHAQLVWCGSTSPSWRSRRIKRWPGASCRAGRATLLLSVWRRCE